MLKSKKILLVIILAIGVIAFNNFVLKGFFKNQGIKLASIVSGPLLERMFPVASFYHSLLAFPGLSRNNQELTDKNQKLLSEVAELESLKRENEFLRSQIGVGRRQGMELIPVKIISIEKNSASSSMIINKGLSGGVRNNEAVISSSNILAGVVWEVFDDHALVLMPDDPRLSVSVKIIPAGGSNGDHSVTLLSSTRGSLAGLFSLGLVTGGDIVNDGDLVVTGGIDGLPEGLPVGNIISVSQVKAGAFNEVNAEMIFNVSFGSNLLVIKNESD